MSRSYRSIGDVLTLLRGEFPDITISKIRFLESQGLVSPQRSPSGYRKFYDEDVERLRYVLVQQREHFLPLKVIRDRLNGIESDEDNGAGDPAPETVSAAPTAVEAPAAVPAAPRSEPEQPVAPTAPTEPAVREPTVADVLAALQEAPRERPATPAATATAPAAKKGRASRVSTGDTMTVDELTAETGLTEAEVHSLVSFGIIKPVDVAGLTCFDEHAVEVARLATGFLSMGVEARHLKQFRNGVDREMGLIEQIVTPLLRQRNPESRARAETTASELASLGRDLHAAMLAKELDALLGR